MIAWPSGAPELRRTIAAPFSVATLYAIVYNALMWRESA